MAIVIRRSIRLGRSVDPDTRLLLLLLVLRLPLLTLSHPNQLLFKIIIKKRNKIQNFKEISHTLSCYLQTNTQIIIQFLTLNLVWGIPNVRCRYVFLSVVRNAAHTSPHWLTELHNTYVHTKTFNICCIVLLLDSIPIRPAPLNRMCDQYFLLIPRR